MLSKSKLSVCCSILLLLILLVTQGHVCAQTILAHWNFEDGDRFVDEATDGNQHILFDATPNSTYYIEEDGPANNYLAADHFQNGIGTKGWTISLNTKGFEQLRLSSIQSGNSSSAADFKLQYSYNQTDWHNIANGIINVDLGWENARLEDIVLPEACSDQWIVYIRWTINSDYKIDGTVGISWASRSYIDEITVSGQAININNRNTFLDAGPHSEVHSISSTHDDAVNMLQIIDFRVSDLGDQGDGVPTYIEQLDFTPATTNQIEDWTTIVAGIRLTSTAFNAPLVGIVNSSSLRFKPSVPIQVSNGTSEDFQLHVYLKKQLPDGIDRQVMALELQTSNIFTSPYGSAFGTYRLNSPDMQIQIEADRLMFSILPEKAGMDQAFGIELVATDRNGNRDINAQHEINLRLYQGSGKLDYGSQKARQTLIDGKANWNELTYNQTDSLWLQAEEESRELQTAISPAIDIMISEGKLMINEIMVDPYPIVGLPEEEYIELYNNTFSAINLKNWQLLIGDKQKLLPDYLLPSDAYLVLCRSAATGLFDASIATLGVLSQGELKNSDDVLTVKDAEGVLIDKVTYSHNWYGDEKKALGGWSLERIDPNKLCSGSANWLASKAEPGGTPGKINSQHDETSDNIAVHLLNVKALSSQIVRLNFSEELDTIQTFSSEHYLLNSQPVAIDSILLKEDYHQLWLYLQKPLTDGRAYTLTLKQLYDWCEHSLDTTIDISYYQVKAHDIVITEIMADPEPEVELPQAEYIELYNRTNYTIDLENWQLSAGKQSSLLPNVMLPPQEYIVVCEKKHQQVFTNYGSFIALEQLPALSNEGATIILKDKDKLVVSAVSYNDGWYEDDFKAEGGWSLEQINQNRPCEGRNNWAASTALEGGTPAQANSWYDDKADKQAPQIDRAAIVNNSTVQVYFTESLDSITFFNDVSFELSPDLGDIKSIEPIGPHYQSCYLVVEGTFQTGQWYELTISGALSDCVGNHIPDMTSARFMKREIPETNDVIINEILFNPKAGGTDFVELFNRSNKAIDLNTLYLASYDYINQETSSEYLITDEHWILYPDSFVAISVDKKVICQSYDLPYPQRLVESQQLPQYSDSRGSVVLLHQSAAIIDSFSYDESMHFALLGTFEGVSLERLSPDRATHQGDNWHSAAQSVGFASPGYQNSQFTDMEASQTYFDIAPETFSPDNDGYNDLLNICYQFDQAGYVAGIKIYNSNGYPIKTITEQELMGTKGCFTWDGTREDNSRASIGIYIIYIELFDLNGQVKHFREVCVLANRLD